MTMAGTAFAAQSGPPANKKILLLSDGTGNSAAKIWKSNVWRVYQAIDHRSSNQIASYNDGVGTSSFKPLAILGGGFGWGLKRNVLELYCFLCRTYDPGDQIYAFGFSRGAFTIRVLLSFILKVGLVTYTSEAELQRHAREAYRDYRRDYSPRMTKALVTVARAMRDAVLTAWRIMLRQKLYSEVPKVPVPHIRFVGLWDTVAAYGFPVDEMTRGIDLWLWPLSLPNRRLDHRIERACHALSLDDERTTFHPMLWTEGKNNGKDERVFPHKDAAGNPIINIAQERLTQVWFPGVHANVGGGYPDDALAFVPLDWIMDQAAQNGLVFDPVKFRENSWRDLWSAQNVRGKRYDSRKGLAGYYRYGPRDIAALSKDNIGTPDEVEIAVPKIHESAFSRMRSGVDAYAPIGLPEKYAVVTDQGAILYGNSNPYEHPTQSTSRVHLQQKAWDWVWFKRIVYFATVAASLYLVAFPVIYANPGGDACSNKLCIIASAIDVLAAFLPGFTTPWLVSFKANPDWFVFGVALLVIFLFTGLWCGLKITDIMRPIWIRLLASKPRAVAAAPPPGSLIYRLRSSNWYKKTFYWTKRHILPNVFALCFLVAILACISRTLFAVGSNAGMICEGGTINQDFSPQSLCWASGYRLLQGETYRITLKMTEPWTDDKIPSSLLGFELSRLPWAQRIVMASAIPLRRIISEPWFRPIIRIGEDGGDEYVFTPADRVGHDQTFSELTAEIKARSDGEMFLFVNDAVIGLPWITDLFYLNNHGRAIVQIERVTGRKN